MFYWQSKHVVGRKVKQGSMYNPLASLWDEFQLAILNHRNAITRITYLPKIIRELEVGYYKVGYHMSNEKRDPGCLGYIGDEQLPSYIGIITLEL